MKFPIISFLIGNLLVLPTFSTPRDGPKLTSEIQVTHENGGITVRFTCYFENYGDAKLMWTRQFGKKLPSQRIIENGWFELSNIQPDDEGMYFCKTFGHLRRSIPRKTYLVPMRIDLAALKQMRGDNDHALGTRIVVRKRPKTTDVFLDCYDLNNPNLRRHWHRHENAQLPPQPDDRNPNEIIIENFQQKYEGWYECDTENDHSGRTHRAIILLSPNTLGLKTTRRRNDNNRPHSQQNSAVNGMTRRPTQTTPSNTPPSYPVTERTIKSGEPQPIITLSPCQNDGVLDIILDCDMSSHRNVTFNWKRQGQSLPEQARNLISAKYSQLEISGIQRKDAGVYYCQTVECELSGKKYHKRAGIRLDFEALREQATQCISHSNLRPNEKVRESPQREINLRIEQAINKNKNGLNVYLKCKDENHQYVKVNWYRHNNQLFSDRVRIYDMQGYGQMDILNVQKDDEGIYYCETADSDPSLKGHRVEIPIYLKELKKKPCAACNENHAAQNPKVIETTRKPASTTTVRPVTEKTIESSQILDKATPEIAITERSKTQNTKFRVQPENHVAEEYDIVNIKCLGKPESAKNFRWFREDNQAFSPVAVISNGELTIYGVELEDAGVYICEYRHDDSAEIERVQATLKVKKFGTIDEEEPCNEEGPEKKLLNGEYPGQGGNFEAAEAPPQHRGRQYNLKIYPEVPIVKEHSNITLSCYDESRLPVPVQWQLRDDKSKSPRAVISNGLMTFTDVRMSDRDFYRCTVKDYPNPQGGARADVTLRVNKF